MLGVRLLFLSILSLSTLVLNAQDVSGNGYRGYIIHKDTLEFVGTDNRVTPTQDDISQAESVLKEKLKSLKRHQLVTSKGLDRYFRQYVGYIDKNGDKIIFINLLHFESSVLKNSDFKNLIIVLDGGSWFWKVKVNLTRGKLFDLSINGEA